MMLLKQYEIKRIVEEMDCGMQCFYNNKNSKLLFFPEELDPDYDMDEYWKNGFDEFNKNKKDYFEIEKPTSHESFEIMKDFSESDLISDDLQNNLIEILNQNKPFANFKNAIDNSDFREEWFAFKGEWMQNWVKLKLETI